MGVYSRTIVPRPVNTGDSRFCIRTMSVPEAYRRPLLGQVCEPNRRREKRTEGRRLVDELRELPEEAGAAGVGANS